MKKFHLGAYKSWRSFWVAAGIFWPAIIIGFHINTKLFNIQFVIVLLFCLVVTISAPFSRYFLYYAIEGSDFIISYFLWNKKIPIKNIISLGYEHRPAWRYLVIKYLDNNGKEIEEERSVDFYDPIVIEKMNKILQAANPSISIIFDNKFQIFMEEEKNLHKKTPETIGGWISFALRWGGITAILNIIVIQAIQYLR